MKRIILLYCLFTVFPAVLPGVLSADERTIEGTVYFISFYNTDDPSIGKTCYEDLQYFYDKFIPELRRGTPMRVQPYYCYGRNFTYSALDAILGSIRPTNKDVIFFYYSGHGYSDKDNEFPILALGGGVYLLDIYNCLSSMDHKLLITISNACNKDPSINIGGLLTDNIPDSYICSLNGNISDSESKQGCGFQEQLQPMLPVSGYTWEKSLLNDLFCNAEGEYMLSSSRSEQYTVLSKDVSMNFLLRGFRDVMDSCRGSISWEAFIVEVAKAAMAYAESFAYIQQQAVWISGPYSPSMVKIVRKSSYPRK